MPDEVKYFSLNGRVNNDFTLKLRLHTFYEPASRRGGCEVLEIRGLTLSGSEIGRQLLRIRRDDITTLIHALEYMQAGPLGRVALDKEREKTNA